MEPWAIVLFAWVYLAAASSIHKSYVDDNPGEAGLVSFVLMVVLWLPCTTVQAVKRVFGVRK